jgi:hypothetical protein
LTWRLRSQWGRPSSVVGATRRGGMDRQAATLMYAGRDRRSAIRRKVPLTSVVSGQAGRHSRNGDRSCHGGAPAHRDDGVHLLGRSRVGGWHGGSGGHLGPQEPGQLSGDGGGDDIGRGLAAAGVGTARRVGAGQSRLELPPEGPGPAGDGRAGCRRWGGAGRPRPIRPAGCEDAGCRPS